MYIKELKIQSYDVDNDNNLKLSSMMKYFQQVARENLDELGFTYKYLLEFGLNNNEINEIVNAYGVYKLNKNTLYLKTKNVCECLLKHKFSRQNVIKIIVKNPSNDVISNTLV